MRTVNLSLTNTNGKCLSNLLICQRRDSGLIFSRSIIADQLQIPLTLRGFLPTHMNPSFSAMQQVERLLGQLAIPLSYLGMGTSFSREFVVEGQVIRIHLSSAIAHHEIKPFHRKEEFPDGK